MSTLGEEIKDARRNSEQNALAFASWRPLCGHFPDLYFVVKIHGSWIHDHIPGLEHSLECSIEHPIEHSMEYYIMEYAMEWFIKYSTEYSIKCSMEYSM